MDTNSEQRCPVCKCRDFRRSIRRGLIERLLSRVLSVKPYRCEVCRTRFFRREKLAMA
jgi:hypothetical protein